MPLRNFPAKTNPTTGGVDVNLQDQHSTIIDLYMHDHGNDVTIVGNPAIGDSTITLVGGHGVVAGNWLGFKQDGHVYEGEVLNVATNIITLDSPLDYTFTADADPSHIHTTNMNVDGSVTPAIFHVTPPAVDPQKWDITRLIFVIEDNTSMDSTTFGGIAGGITNGIVIRSNNGIVKNIFNAKTNGDMAARAFDVGYDDRASGSSFFAFRARTSFAGQSKRGVTIRLDGETADALEIIVQDDLRSLSKFICIAQGHVVID